MTPPTKREATCPMCDMPIEMCGEHAAQREDARRAGLWNPHDDKPPERAEWLNWIDTYGAAAWSAGRRRVSLTAHDDDLETTRNGLRAAVQRALDEREAATRTDDMRIIGYTLNADIKRTDLLDTIRERRAAAEARAKGKR